MMFADSTQCHFFAGIGGWSLALRLAGWPDDRAVWTGSCPCQPWSAVNTNRRGRDDARHLWPAWFGLIAQCAPDHVFGEQVASQDGLGWLDGVRAQMEGAGYAVGAVDLVGSFVGSMQEGARLFFVAEADGDRRRGWPATARRDTRRDAPRSGERLERIACADGKTRLIEPGIEPLADDLPARVGRLRGYGNAIAPQVAATFIEAYVESV